MTKELTKELIQMARNKVLEATREYYNIAFGTKQPFSPGDKINYAGRVFNNEELEYLVNSALDFWLTTGRFSEEFEKSLSTFLNVEYVSLTNSGSSANLLAFMALTSSKLGKRRILPGDEVITVAASFPTTVTPIIQYGAIPVFVDIEIPTYNINASLLEEARSDKTKAVMIAHTLGNPFDLKAVLEFCQKHDLWLIEDNCDALGAQYFYNGHWKYTGTFGHIGTSSFYPAHHLTMGEGGAVYTNDMTIKRLVDSFRDWGRDCWCAPGRDNTCTNRFSQQFGELPIGYDHKYVYSHFGYNLKLTEMQSAVGCAQIKKLPDFIKIRQNNWRTLREGLQDLRDLFILPEITANSEPSWFGFILTIRKDNGIRRDQVVQFLERRGIQTRTLFAGNLIKHPCFDEMRASGKGYRIVGQLDNTEIILNDTFWIGVYPGLTESMLQYILNSFYDLRKNFHK